MVENEGNNPYQLFQILPNGSSEQNLTFEVPVNKVPYSLAFEPTALASAIGVQVFDGYSQFEPSNDANLTSALKVEDLTLTPSQEQLTIVSKLNTDAIDYDGVYLYQTKIGVESLETPLWWQDWSWQKVNDQNGARTQNFARFMTQLKDISFDVMSDQTNAGAPIGLLCYGIQK
ncbi:MAG: hypothetical protein HC796_02345 [Synechococcaceae cyanobacterium RL_1_2]|nr:hypothetical protein [Synechococcaceae cyanobacterium RL_1_2]